MSGSGGGHEGGIETGLPLGTGEKQSSILFHLPESSGAEAMCPHIFSSSAKLHLGEAKDKSPEVCMFDSHLT